MTADLAALLARVKARLGVADDGFAAPAPEGRAGKGAPRRPEACDAPSDHADEGGRGATTGPPEARPDVDEDSGPRQKCSYDLPADLAHAFRAVCAIQGVKQRRVIERLVAAYVARHASRKAA